MKKQMLIMLLFLLPLVLALDECKAIIETPIAEIPCHVATTWETSKLLVPTNCSNITVKVYDIQGFLVENKSLGNFGIFCNFTFSNRTASTYYYNISQGDAGNILVKPGDNMTSTGVIMFFMILTGVVFWLGIKGRFTGKPIADFIIQRSVFSAGIFLILLDLSMIVTMASNAGLGIQEELFLFLWIVERIGWVSLFILGFSTFLQGLHLAKINGQTKRMGGGDFEEE